MMDDIFVMDHGRNKKALFLLSVGIVQLEACYQKGGRLRIVMVVIRGK